MSRQERTARAVKRADVKVTEMVQAATRKVKCRKCGTAGTRTELKAAGHGSGCQASQNDVQPRSTRSQVATPAPAASTGNDPLSAECRRLRDVEGLSWMAIGAKLGLPGSKNGAANARKLYAQNGTPHVKRSRVTSASNRPAKPATSRGSKAERKLAVVAGSHVIPEDTTDEEVVALVAGRTIEWGINLARLAPGPDHWINQEARVHPNDVMVEEERDADGSRVLRFREFLGYDDDKRSPRYGQPMGGTTRTVRLSAIHTVR